MSNIDKLFERGMVCEAKRLSSAGVEVTLDRGVVHRVLVLDVTRKRDAYPAIQAVDSLNNLGWCKFDDISEDARRGGDEIRKGDGDA